MGKLSMSLTRAFDALTAPLSKSDPMWLVLLASMLTGVLVVLIFRSTSDQRAISRAREAMFGHLIEAWLYRFDPIASLRAQGKIVISNLRCLKHSLLPLCIMVPLMVIIVVQLGLRLDHQPVSINEPFIVTARLAAEEPAEVTLIPPEGVVLETPPLRIDHLKQVEWRLRAEREGLHLLRVRTQGAEAEKTLLAGTRIQRVSTLRERAGLHAALLNPAEVPLAPNSPLEKIAVRYPARLVTFLGWRTHWLVPFSLLSILFGMMAKHFLKISI